MCITSQTQLAPGHNMEKTVPLHVYRQQETPPGLFHLLGFFYMQEDLAKYLRKQEPRVFVDISFSYL